MANGVEQQIGIGSAQVLPDPANVNAFVQQLNEQKRYKDQQDRYMMRLKKQDEKDLYDLIGETLNLKDFNPVIHDKVKKSQIELAQKIKSENPSYADVYLAAQNKAAELGTLSTGLNQLDQQLALTKKEYESDKRINAGAIEMIARKKILDQLKATGSVDPSINYFDEALNEHPEFALTDKADYTITDFIPEEKQAISGKFKEINRAGRTDQFDWKADIYPVYYEFKDNGEAKAPEIKTRSQPSGLKDESGLDVPMLSDDAYGRFKAKPSNVVALNRRIRAKYGDIDLKSEQAEILRKVEAFKDVDRQKPRVNTTRVEKEAPIRSHAFYFGGSGASGTPSNVNDLYRRMNKTLDDREAQGQAFAPLSLFEQDAKDLILKTVRNALKDEEVTQDELKVIRGADGSLRVFDKNNDFVTYIGETPTNIGVQPGVVEKREVIKKGNTPTKQDKPKSDPLKLF